MADLRSAKKFLPAPRNEISRGARQVGAGAGLRQ